MGVPNALFPHLGPLLGQVLFSLATYTLYITTTTRALHGWDTGFRKTTYYLYIYPRYTLPLTRTSLSSGLDFSLHAFLFRHFLVVCSPFPHFILASNQVG
jgi:hypothetical protein